MGPALLVAGLILVVSAVRGTQDDLFSLLKGDLTGQRNFLYWILAIAVVGAVGYIPRAKPLSNAFLVLIVVAIVLSNKGFFRSFMQQLNSTSGVSSNG